MAPLTPSADCFGANTRYISDRDERSAGSACRDRRFTSRQKWQDQRPIPGIGQEMAVENGGKWDCEWTRSGVHLDGYG